jgi:hypothetical protein
VRSVLKNWKVLLLAMLIAWSGISYAYHVERSPPDHDSAYQLAKEIADQSGQLEKQCDHCCHGGSHSQALCSEQFVICAHENERFDLEVVALPHTRATPPLTPPPQA